MAQPIKILSYGGGLNSFTMLLYSIEQGNPPDWCVFADTGSGNWEEWSRDGEWYGTYRHMVEYVIPLCEANGIGFKWITHEDSKVRGSDSLLKYFEYLHTVPGRKNRFCSEIAKIERIEQWIWETLGDSPAEVWIGFESGEESRRFKDVRGAKTCGQPYDDDDGGEEEAGAFKPKPTYKPKYPINRTMIFPLIGAGICRCRCEVYVRQHEYPVPRKSACWFCPFSKRGDWMTLAQQMPDQFARAAALEAEQKGTAAGKLIYFNTIERKGEELPSPLYDNIHLPYSPKVEQCKVCCRDPKATKVPGIAFLTAAEYVQYEEPLGPWEPGPWDPGFGIDPWKTKTVLDPRGGKTKTGKPKTITVPVYNPPSCDVRQSPYIEQDWTPPQKLGQAEAVLMPEAVALSAMNLTQENILQWLSNRIGQPVVDGTLAIPVEHLDVSRHLLDWFHRHTKIDRDLNPESAREVEDLQERLAAEVGGF